MKTNTKLVGTKVGQNAFFFELAGPQYVKPPAREFTVDLASTFEPNLGKPPPPLKQFITGPVQKATGANIYPPTAASPTPEAPGFGQPDAQRLPPADAAVSQDRYIEDKPAPEVQPGQGQRDPEVPLFQPEDK